MLVVQRVVVKAVRLDWILNYFNDGANRFS